MPAYQPQPIIYSVAPFVNNMDYQVVAPYAPQAQYAVDSMHNAQTAPEVMMIPCQQYFQPMAYAPQPVYLVNVPPQPVVSVVAQQDPPRMRASPQPPAVQQKTMGLYVTKKQTGDATEKKQENPTYVHNPYTLPAVTQADNAESSSDTEGEVSVLNSSNITTDSESGKKKRKRKKKVVVDNNKACDALRFKTRICKNWETTNKCPYGPRCLFAHGKKEMRSFSENNEAILSAGRTSSPLRNFFAIGKFPSFIPVPYELLQLGRDTVPSTATAYIPTPVTREVINTLGDPTRMLPEDIITDKAETMTA
jgi:hypothetical protein